MEIAALIIAILSIVLSGFALYFAELRRVNIKLAPITDIGIMVGESTELQNKRKAVLLVSVSLFNAGSKPAWIDDIKLTTESNNEKIEMVCIGWILTESISLHININRDLLPAFYPITIAPESQKAFVPFFTSFNYKEDLKPKQKYEARIQMKYQKKMVSAKFAFELPRTLQEFNNMPKNKITRFTPVGIERGVGNVRIGEG